MTGTSQAEIWVITDQAHPVTATESSRVLLLDAQEHLEKQLTAALPQDPQQVQAAFKRLLQSPDGRRLQDAMVNVQQDVADAWSIGVEKIPAVVVATTSVAPRDSWPRNRREFNIHLLGLQEALHVAKLEFSRSVTARRRYSTGHRSPARRWLCRSCACRPIPSPPPQHRPNYSPARRRR
ncbi:TIGR03757 family integrating conjugative element protein [Pseudomonas aeruginosa]|uniref:TIGR03757 family integrating conjugative element protein n=1 Tax=Pseudomonas aeruginosa TaxID=287 RepID=UPI00383ADD39